MKIQATLTLLTQVFLLVSLGDGFLLSFRSRQRKYVERAYVLHEKKGPLGGGSSNDVTPTPRSTAAFALMNSLTKKNPMFATRQLENDKNFLNLSSRDRAFSKLLLTTVERRQGQIDKVISKFVKSKQKKDRLSDKLCLCCIRLGAAQLLFLDTPPHAALQETVEVLRMHDRIKVSKPQINYVNAMLRSIDREGRREVEKSTTIFDNIAPWLAEEWLTTYGKEKTERILKASMEQSPIFISVNHVRDSTTEERATKLQAIQKLFSVNDQSANLLPHGSIEIPKEFHGAVSQWPLYEEGEWWVQDPSASLPAIALSNALCKENTAAVHVVDLCSAPGGKTSQLCSFGFGKVTAIEVSKRRTKALHENIKRLGMNDLCEIVVADGREWVPDNTNDSVQGVLGKLCVLCYQYFDKTLKNLTAFHFSS